MTASLLTFPAPTRPTVRASIQCIDCDWAAATTADTATEASRLLCELYRRHLAEHHPDLTFSEVPS